MMLVEIEGPDPRIPNRDAIYWRTVIEDDATTQRIVADQIGSVLPDGWHAIFRPLGSLDGIVEALSEKKAYALRGEGVR